MLARRQAEFGRVGPHHAAAGPGQQIHTPATLAQPEANFDMEVAAVPVPRVGSGASLAGVSSTPAATSGDASTGMLPGRAPMATRARASAEATNRFLTVGRTIAHLTTPWL